MGQSHHSSGASRATCKTGGPGYVSKGHLQLCRPSASVTRTAAWDSHTYCGPKLSPHLVSAFLLTGYFAISSSAYAFSLLCFPQPPLLLVWLGFGFLSPCFSPNVSTREREHDSDSRPLDVNYVLLESLRNRPENKPNYFIAEESET